jgi:hypothetical protein
MCLTGSPIRHPGHVARTMAARKILFWTTPGNIRYVSETLARRNVRGNRADNW